MKSHPQLFLFLLATTLSYAQIGEMQIIDATIESAGVTKFTSSDINNDGNNDLIVSFTGSAGKLAYYENLENNSFSTRFIIDDFPFCRGVAVGDFNDDGWDDLVAIGNIGLGAKIYFNISGIFGSSVTLDSNISDLVNDVVVADFDMNTSDDIVIIGQHSIDFYRNDGTGSFTKETILSTSTSPLSLECLDLAIADVDADGDMDLINGETEGLVIYTNNGNGVFTPQYHSIIPEIIFLVQPVDIDDDGDIDVITKNQTGAVKWFSNDGSGNMTYQSTLATIPNLTSLSTIDVDADGLQDIYASYTNNIAIFFNNPTHTFNTTLSIHQNNSLIMGAVQLINIDNLSGLDYVWSGGNNTVAFHLNESQLSLEEATVRLVHPFHPNPTQGRLTSNVRINKLTLYSALGETLLQVQNVQTLNLETLSTGVYYISYTVGNTIGFQKIVKN